MGVEASALHPRSTFKARRAEPQGLGLAVQLAGLKRPLSRAFVMFPWGQRAGDLRPSLPSAARPVQLERTQEHAGGEKGSEEATPAPFA